MTFDLYVWASPRDFDDDDEAGTLVDAWQAAGGDPATSPFEPSTDVGWFHRELMKDAPWLQVSSDAVPNPSTRPMVLSTTDEPPARVVAIRLSSGTLHELNEIASLAAKYDLVLYDARDGRVRLPLEEMAAYASATFWPAGAIQAAVAGAIGLAMAAAAWVIGIPVLSWIVILIGGFLVVMAVFTFLHEGRKALRARRTGGSPRQ